MLEMVKKAGTERGKQIVSILKQSKGQWLTRSKIAEGLSKKDLNHHDREILERLEQEGFIEIDRRIREDMVAEYIYRATDKQMD